MADPIDITKPGALVQPDANASTAALDTGPSLEELIRMQRGLVSSAQEELFHALAETGDKDLRVLELVCSGAIDKLMRLYHLDGWRENG